MKGSKGPGCNFQSFRKVSNTKRLGFMVHGQEEIDLLDKFSPIVLNIFDANLYHGVTIQCDVKVVLC